MKSVQGDQEPSGSKRSTGGATLSFRDVAGDMQAEEVATKDPSGASPSCFQARAQSQGLTLTRVRVHRDYAMRLNRRPPANFLRCASSSSDCRCSSAAQHTGSPSRPRRRNPHARP